MLPPPKGTTPLLLQHHCRKCGSVVTLLFSDVSNAPFLPFWLPFDCFCHFLTPNNPFFRSTILLQMWFYDLWTLLFSEVFNASFLPFGLHIGFCHFGFFQAVLDTFWPLLNLFLYNCRKCDSLFCGLCSSQKFLIPLSCH